MRRDSRLPRLHGTLLDARPCRTLASAAPRNLLAFLDHQAGNDAPHTRPSKPQPRQTSFAVRHASVASARISLPACRVTCATRRRRVFAMAPRRDSSRARATACRRPAASARRSSLACRKLARALLVTHIAQVPAPASTREVGLACQNLSSMRCVRRVACKTRRSSALGMSSATSRPTS